MNSASARDPSQAIRKQWRAAAAAALMAAMTVGGLLVALAFAVPHSSESARRKLTAVLGERLDADVELTDLKFRLFPRFRAEGQELSVRHKGRRDVPPMIAVKHFTADASIVGLLRKHFARVVVDELDIEIPPDHNRESGRPYEPGQPTAQGAARDDVGRTIVIDELVSTDGRLSVIPREPNKRPKVWGIRHLRMGSVSLNRAMAFTATLTNAMPPGEIETSGSFGPWQSEEPGETLLDGTFTFARADLSIFRGISGILSARGTYGGTVEHIDIHGETDTPQFTVMAGGHAIPLHATYHAVVDGTNGNTLLEEVDASFLQTSLVAKGGVVGAAGTDGRTVTLDVQMDRARLEDVLRMAINTPLPPMTGALKLTTKFVLPPGDRGVVQKLRLDGTFAIADTRFTNPEVQTKINQLSRRARGQTPDQKMEHVSSHFAGTFALANSRLSIPGLAFDVPGSAIRLSGSYGLVSEKVDFVGTAYTDAKISQMMTGVKRVFLKPVDLIFRSDGGGAAIPIKITGTRSEPSFGLDRGRVFNRH